MPSRKSLALLVVLLASCAMPVVRPGDLVRVHPPQGTPIEGRLLGSTRDSLAISTTAGDMSLSRESVARLELDRHARRGWQRPFECAYSALSGIAAIFALRSDDSSRATASLSLAAVASWMCLKPHDWARARLPDEPER